VDHRVIEALVDDEISIGDYVLTNGALAAAVVCDAVIRLLPGALGDERSPLDESFSDPNLLEAPAYTRPIEFRGMRVPEVLVSGHHGKIEAWKAGKRPGPHAPQPPGPVGLMPAAGGFSPQAGKIRAVPGISCHISGGEQRRPTRR
jgi:hypothetical protein